MRPPIIHRDLKTLNIFLTAPLPLLPLSLGCSCSTPPSSLTSPPCPNCLSFSFLSWNTLPVAKVGDFGLSTELVGLNELRVASSSHENGSLSCINPTWAAPEILAGKPYSLQSDVYGYGLFLWELLTREPPFQDIPIFFRTKEVENGGRPQVPKWVSEQGELGRGYLSLMERCWDGDPEKRPKMGEVYECLRSLLGMVGPELVGMFPERENAVESEIGGLLSSSLSSSSSCSVPMRDAECIVNPFPIESPNSYFGEKGEDLAPGKTTMRVCSMATALGRFVWVGFKNGRVSVFNGEGGPNIKFIHCVEEHCHVQSVNALLWDSSRGLVWSGSEDGGLKVCFSFCSLYYSHIDL